LGGSFFIAEWRIAFPGWLRESSGEATLDDPPPCYQHPGRLTGKLENTRCPEVAIWEISPDFLDRRFWPSSGLPTNRD
jgi:hypothetical protein